MAAIKLEVVTPSGKLVEAETDSLTAPGVAGEVGILPNHRPALIQLSGGLIEYRGGAVFIRGGVAEVRPDAVLVLSEQATLPENADRAEAEALLQRSNAALDNKDFISEAKLAEVATDRSYAEAILKRAGH